MTKLLALDTSLASTGWSIYIDGKYVRSGTIKPTVNKSKSSLNNMATEILDFIAEESPNIIVTELTVVTRNAQSQRDLTLLLGVIYGYCLVNDVFYHSFRPSEWRKLIDTEKPAGRKREQLKEWSINSVKQLYDIDCASDDVSDAILIGLAYINWFSRNVI